MFESFAIQLNFCSVAEGLMAKRRVIPVGNKDHYSRISKISFKLGMLTLDITTRGVFFQTYITKYYRFPALYSHVPL